MNVLSSITLLLLALCCAVCSGLRTTSSQQGPQNITKVASIDLGFKASLYPQTLVWGEIFYSVQFDGTLVAVNVTSQAVLWHTVLPDYEIYGMYRSKSGYLIVLDADAEQPVRIIDPSGRASKSDHVILPPCQQWGPDSLVYLSQGVLVSLNLKTDEKTVLLQGSFESSTFPKSKPTTVVLQESSGFGVLRVSKIFEYDYQAKRKSNWTIEGLRGGLYLGQDGHRIFASNTSAADKFQQENLLLFDTATGARLEFGPYSDVDSNYGVSPALQGELINFIHAEPSELTILNTSTGVVAKQQPLHSSVFLFGTHLVTWGSALFSVYTYPGGATTVNKTLSQGPHPNIVTMLPGTDLVVGTFNTKIQVRDLKTGVLIYEQSVVNPHNLAYPPPPRVMADQRLLVLTNGDKADVLHF